MPVFDRIPSIDPRNSLYPMRTTHVTRPLRSYTWRHAQLDQGNEGACTGFAATMEAAARPVMVFGYVWELNDDPAKLRELNLVARQIYHDAQRLDDIPGVDYEGSTVLGAMKAGQARGWWTGYRWATGSGVQMAADVAVAVAWSGPVIVGSAWFEGMLGDGTPNGLLLPTGEVLGGHAWLVNRYSLKRNAVWTPNSWGGQGQGWIRLEDLALLLARDGEAAVPVGRKHG